MKTALAVIGVIALIVFVFGGFMYLLAKERSHECNWYVERNFATKDVPYRCIVELENASK